MNTLPPESILVAASEAAFSENADQIIGVRGALGWGYAHHEDVAALAVMLDHGPVFRIDAQGDLREIGPEWPPRPAVDRSARAVRVLLHDAAGALIGVTAVDGTANSFDEARALAAAAGYTLAPAGYYVGYVPTSDEEPDAYGVSAIEAAP